MHVLAVDLLGHGRSDKPSVGYSLGLFADHLDELLDTLSVPAATVVGHSLGGAIAMALGYAHPDRVQRLVLVSAGGLGREVHPILRAASLPGSRAVLCLTVNRRTGAILGSARLHRRLRIPPDTVVNLSRAGRNLYTGDGRRAFVTTLRSVITPRGQIGSMIEASYLARHVPTLIVWSERDHVIPVEHAERLNRYLPDSRLELFPGSSHEPHRRYAQRFAAALADFVDTTDPAR